MKHLLLSLVAISFASSGLARAGEWEQYHHSGTEKPYSVKVLDLDDPWAIKSLEDAAKKLNFSVVEKSCQILTDLPIGTAQGNHSFGGICEVDFGGVEVTAMICDDILVGRPTIQIITHPTRHSLHKFVVENCYGG